MSRANQQYFSKHATMMMVAGGIFLVVALAYVTSADPERSISPFVTAGLMLGIGLWTKVTPIVQLKQDHLEIKLAVARPTKLVLYKEILEVSTGSDKKVWLFTEGGRIRVPTHAMNPEDAINVVAELKSRVGQHGGSGKTRKGAAA